MAARLSAAGWRILARNARPAGVRGELDIVARHREDLVFIEVKARSAGAVRGPTSPVLAVGPRKQGQLRRLAAAWMREGHHDGRPARSVRFDVAGVWLDGAGRVLRVEYLRQAF